MLDQIGLQPGDRVLFLAIPSLAVIEQMSPLVQHGIVVCLGDRDSVADARKAARHLENAMFSPGTPDEIPWQDGVFNRVLEMGGVEYTAMVCREIARVLTAGAEAWLSQAASGEALVRAGLTVLEPSAGFQRFAKPQIPAPPGGPAALPVLG